jgi:hypothetical protein
MEGREECRRWTTVGEWEERIFANFGVGGTTGLELKMAWIFPRLKRKDQREVLWQDYKQKNSSLKRYDYFIDFSVCFVSSSPDPLYDDLIIDIHISVAELRPLPR